VIVVAHEAVGMAEPGISVIDMLQGAQEILAVLVVSKNSFLFISSAGDMIDRSRIFYAQRTSHRETISSLCEYIMIKDLTPLAFSFNSPNIP